MVRRLKPSDATICLEYAVENDDSMDGSMAIKDAYHPDLFTLVPKSQLSKRHFDMHPIWSEYYDYDEREEIASWGVNREWLDRELLRVHEGSDHCAYPILRPYPLPDRMRLYIRARFVTAGGARLDGYVMNDDAFVATLFASDSEYAFSRHSALGDLNDRSLRALKAAIGRDDDPIFPLQYETDFLGLEDAPIAGTFTAGAD